MKPEDIRQFKKFIAFTWNVRNIKDRLALPIEVEFNYLSRGIDSAANFIPLLVKKDVAVMAFSQAGRTVAFQTIEDLNLFYDFYKLSEL